MSRKCSCGWKCTQHTKIPPRFLKGWVNSLRFSESCRQSYCSKQGTAWFFFSPKFGSSEPKQSHAFKIKMETKGKLFSQGKSTSTVCAVAMDFFSSQTILHIAYVTPKENWLVCIRMCRKLNWVCMHMRETLL